MGWWFYVQEVGTPDTLFVLTELFDLFALRGSGEQKISSNCMGARPCTLTTLGTRPCTLTTRVRGHKDRKAQGCKGGRVQVTGGHKGVRVGGCTG